VQLFKIVNMKTNEIKNLCIERLTKLKQNQATPLGIIHLKHSYNDKWPQHLKGFQQHIMLRKLFKVISVVDKTKVVPISK